MKRLWVCWVLLSGAWSTGRPSPPPSRAASCQAPPPPRAGAGGGSATARRGPMALATTPRTTPTPPTTTNHDDWQRTIECCRLRRSQVLGGVRLAAFGAVLAVPRGPGGGRGCRPLGPLGTAEQQGALREWGLS
eukprot:9492694-Pyramimonas_sp.AAC.1